MCILEYFKKMGRNITRPFFLNYSWNKRSEFRRYAKNKFATQGRFDKMKAKKHKKVTA